MGKLGLFILLGGLTWAQPADELVRASLSPYDLARYIGSHTDFDWTPLWKALNIDDATIFLQPCDQSRTCSTEFLTVRTPPQTILIIHHHSWDFEVYLRYMGGGRGEWRFAGAYSPFVKYFAPRHKLVRFGPKPFLIVTGQGAAGTGLSTKFDDWIDLTGAAMEPVFGHTSEAHLLMFGGRISHDAKAFITSLSTRPVESIEVTRHARFYVEARDGRLELGSRKDVTTYVRRPGESEFKFEKSSALPETDLDTVYEDWDSFTPTHEQFLRYDLESLKSIASGPDSREKRWLRKYLADCPETDEKKQLVTLLARR